MEPKWNVKVFHVDFHRWRPASINGTKVECKDGLHAVNNGITIVLMEPKWNVKNIGDGIS